MVSKGKATSPGSFIRLTSLLSPGCDLSEVVAMAKLWANVLEAANLPLTPDCPRTLTMDIQAWVDDEYFSAALYNGAVEVETHLTDEQAQSLLKQYPPLQDYRLRYRDGGHPPACHRPYDQSGTLPVSYLVWLCWPRGEDAGVDDYRLVLDKRTTDYRGAGWCSPGTGLPTPSPCTRC